MGRITLYCTRPAVATELQWATSSTHLAETATLFFPAWIFVHPLQ